MEKPPYLNILVSSDQEQYAELRSALSSEKRRYQRFRRTDSFDEILNEIRHFCIRGNEDDWKRCLVCGICWPDGCIGVNVKQLALLINKSKSNINGVLAKLGYVSDNSSSEFKHRLIECLPILRGNHLEQRFWTIRYNPTMTPKPDYNSVQISSPEESTHSGEQKKISETPEPVRPHNIDVPGGESVKSMFDITEMKICDHHECGAFCENFDFFSDAACCCQAEWFNSTDSSAEDMFSFA